MTKPMLYFETVHIRRVIFSLEVIIEPCPPGFVHNSENREARKCECSAYTNHSFSGIRSCDDEMFQAKLLINYWVGYFQNNITEEFGSEGTL